MIAVMATAEGAPLILRGNPTLEEVKGFIREHNRRFDAGIPGGPSGLPAKQIVSARWLYHERDLNQPGTDIDISDLASA